MASKALTYVIKFLKDGTSYESTKTVGPTDIPAIDSTEWTATSALCEVTELSFDPGDSAEYQPFKGNSGLVGPGEPITTKHDLRITFTSDDVLSSAMQSVLQTDTISSTATALLAKPRSIKGAFNVAEYDESGTLVQTLNFRGALRAETLSRTRGEAAMTSYSIQVIGHANNKIKLPA